MKFCGKIAGLSKDMVTGRVLMQIEVLPSDGALDGFDRVQGCDCLEVTIEKPRSLRSRNANAYFHALVGEIAAALTISRQRCKNMLICRYGQPELNDDGTPVRCIINAPDDYMAEHAMLHAIATGVDDSTGATIYDIYRGTHTYDDKEMGRLIEGAVSEAIGLGIETIAGDRLKDIKKRRAKENNDMVSADELPEE